MAALTWAAMTEGSAPSAVKPTIGQVPFTLQKSGYVKLAPCAGNGAAKTGRIDGNPKAQAKGIRSRAAIAIAEGSETRRFATFLTCKTPTASGGPLGVDDIVRSSWKHEEDRRNADPAPNSWSFNIMALVQISDELLEDEAMNIPDLLAGAARKSSGQFQNVNLLNGTGAWGGILQASIGSHTTAGAAAIVAKNEVQKFCTSSARMGAIPC